MIDVEYRRVLVSVLLPRVERIVADLRMDGTPDLRAAARRLLTEPIEMLGTYGAPMNTLRALASIPDAIGRVDTATVEGALRECFDIVLALA